MSDLRVRAYNVRFGDALLISIPDRDEGGVETTRHILIDVGNVLAGHGASEDVFIDVFDDIESELGGRPLDLYVMTHEHLDHVQGLFSMHKRHGRALEISHAWLTASAEGDPYYDRFEDAKRRRVAALDALETAQSYLRAQGAPPRQLRGLLEANDTHSTEKCVDYLRTSSADVQYVHREWDPTGHHPFREAKLSVWAPEENTATYYGRFRPMQIAMTEPDEKGRRRPRPPAPPVGVDLGAFMDLVESRRRHVDTVLAIDTAANNTSIVLSIEWRGWRLLFPGDAEHRSWREMARQKQPDGETDLLQEVHLLKVGHHGSHNALPPGEILDRILPAERRDERRRYAILSTCTGVYHEVPHDATLEVIESRVDELTRTDRVDEGGWVDVMLRG